jgi:hypothetical protein
MITFVSLTLVPLLLAYLFSIWSRQKVVVWLPASFMLISLWVLVFGMADKLLLGVQLILPCLLLLSLFTIYFRRDLITVASIRDSISPAVTLFVTLSAFTFFQTQNMRFYLWDEFSGWGQFVKSMFLFDALGPFSPAKIGFPEYLSGISILPYLTVKVGGIWDEADVYWSYQIFIISIVVSILSFIEWKKHSLNLLAISSSLLIATLYFNSLNSVYADPLLGLIFGFGIIVITSKNAGKDKGTLLNFAIIVCFLGTVKEIGFFFSLILISLMFIINCIGEVQGKSERNYVVFRALSLSLLISIPVFALKFAWELVISNQMVSTDRSILPLIKSLVSSGSGDLPSYVQELTSKFLSKTFAQPLTGINAFPLTVLTWLILLTLLWTLLVRSKHSKRDKQKEAAIYVTLLFGALGYLAILWLSYLVVFSPFEGVGAASFERYVFTYFLGLLLYLNFQFVSLIYVRPLRNKSLAFVSVWIVFLMLQASPSHLLAYLHSPSAASDGFMTQFNDQRRLINEFDLSVDDDVWIISQHTIGFEYQFLKYEMLPASVGLVPWSIGSPSGDGDVWTDTTMTAEKWDVLLRDYDYVYLDQGSESFLNEFGGFFVESEEFLSAGFFRVLHGNNGTRLIRVEKK